MKQSTIQITIQVVPGNFTASIPKKKEKKKKWYYGK